jgi:hypothetical protein
MFLLRRRLDDNFIKVGSKDVDLLHLAQVKEWWQALVKTVTNHLFG